MSTVGLRGSYWSLLVRVAGVLAFNAIVIAVLALLPYWIGHASLHIRAQVQRHRSVGLASARAVD